MLVSSPTLASPLVRPLRSRSGDPRRDPAARPARPRRASLGAPAAASIPAPAVVPALVPVPPAGATRATARSPQRSAGHVGRRALGIAAAVVGLVGLGVPALAVADVVTTAREDVRTPTDAIVVLGAAQYWGDPTPVLEARLEHARELLAGGVAPVIVTVGAGRPGDATSEADVARSWLLSHGVAPDSVVSVPAGGDTVSSLRAVSQMVGDLDWDSVTVVSDPANVARASAVASSLGLEAAVSPTRTGPGSGLTAEYVARETVSLLGYQLRGRWAETAATEDLAAAG